MVFSTGAAKGTTGALTGETFGPGAIAPNQRTLVTGRTFMIGLVVPELVHPFFAEIARTLSQTIRPKGYNLVIACSEADPELERQEIESLMARQVDALVLEFFQHAPLLAGIAQRRDKDMRLLEVRGDIHGAHGDQDR